MVKQQPVGVGRTAGSTCRGREAGGHAASAPLTLPSRAARQPGNPIKPAHLQLLLHALVLRRIAVHLAAVENRHRRSRVLDCWGRQMVRSHSTQAASWPAADAAGAAVISSHLHTHVLHVGIRHPRVACAGGGHVVHAPAVAWRPAVGEAAERQQRAQVGWLLHGGRSAQLAALDTQPQRRPQRRPAVSSQAPAGRRPPVSSLSSRTAASPAVSPLSTSPAGSCSSRRGVGA